MHDSAHGTDVSSQLPILKQQILLNGIDADEAGMSAQRIYIWLVLLQCSITPYSTYAALLARGASPSYAKINNDTFRTLATDPLFARRVTNNSISRILNTIAWALHDAALEKIHAGHSIATTTPLPPSPVLEPRHISDNNVTCSPLTESSTVKQTSGVQENDIPCSILAMPPSPIQAPSLADNSSIALPTSIAPATYLQGMNVLAAPFLYVCKSEPQAYTLLLTLLTTHIPSYITPSMTGVHSGLSLLSHLLAVLDPTLSTHLLSKQLHPTTYAFPSVLTLSACTPPLPEVLILWDFYFAWGVHLNVLAVVAQLHLMRDKLLSSDSPGRELRNMGPLRARKVIELVISFIPRVEQDLWDEMVTHTDIQHDPKEVNILNTM